MEDPTDIDTWRRLDDRLTTSGQPTEAELAALQALGIRHVVNLALHVHERALPDERASLAALGIGYTHIPVDFHSPTSEDFAQFCAVMAAYATVPVHVHCIANFRVSAFIYRWRRDLLGMNEATARADLVAVWQPSGAWPAFIA